MIEAGDPGRHYLDRFTAELPRALTLLDRDPSSPTHGCFDRNHWHYRTQDFPSGMYQELALPLAQAFAFDWPGNRWHGEPRIRELALAAVDYAARSAHGDGSCDDYFPNERALGATAFAAAAHAEAINTPGLIPAKDTRVADISKGMSFDSMAERYAKEEVEAHF